MCSDALGSGPASAPEEQPDEKWQPRHGDESQQPDARSEEPTVASRMQRRHTDPQPVRPCTASVTRGGREERRSVTRRASFNVQLARSMANCETFAEAQHANLHRSGCASRHNPMSFSRTRRSVGESDVLSKTRSQVETSKKSLSIAAKGQTLGEAIHSYNRHGAGRIERVNFMSFSKQAKTFEEFLKKVPSGRPQSAIGPRGSTRRSSSTPELLSRRCTV